tara:strand:- start:31 stop:201 length:171 start_codon:yes stop_codon:yes gene_type:complete
MNLFVSVEEKLKTIEHIAKKGKDISVDEISKMQFEQILHEVNELIGASNGEQKTQG